jgi:hypothetical protein
MPPRSPTIRATRLRARSSSPFLAHHLEVAQVLHDVLPALALLALGQGHLRALPEPPALSGRQEREGERIGDTARAGQPERVEGGGELPAIRREVDEEPPAGRDGERAHGAEIGGLHRLRDETPGAVARPNEAGGARVCQVEHEEPQSTRRRRDDRGRSARGLRGTREIDHVDPGDRLLLPVVGELEVGESEPDDRPAVRPDDGDRDLDERHARLLLDDRGDRLLLLREGEARREGDRRRRTPDPPERHGRRPLAGFAPSALTSP